MAETIDQKAKRRYTGAKFEIGPADKCWIWQGTIGADGYGRLLVGGRTGKHLLAHRLVYRLLVGHIPATHQLDHRCRRRACVNPAHLEVVTNRENALRRPDVLKARSRKRCPKGHRMIPANIYVRPNGTVQCRECKRESVRKWRRKRHGGNA